MPYEAKLEIFSVFHYIYLIRQVNELNLKSREFIHFGDNKHADMLSCVKIGIRTVLNKRDVLNNFFMS